jgi:hypothetical protein
MAALVLAHGRQQVALLNRRAVFYAAEVEQTHWLLHDPSSLISLTFA